MFLRLPIFEKNYFVYFVINYNLIIGNEYPQNFKMSSISISIIIYSIWYNF